MGYPAADAPRPPDRYRGESPDVQRLGAQSDARSRRSGGRCPWGVGQCAKFL